MSAEQKASFPEYYGRNVWPDAREKGIEGFEEAFKSLGKCVSRELIVFWRPHSSFSRFIFDVGRELAAACQPFGISDIKSSFQTFTNDKLFERHHTWLISP